MALRRYNLKLIESLKSDFSVPKNKRTVKALKIPKLKVDAKIVFKSLKSTPGFNEISRKVTNFQTLSAWQQIAYFSVCKKTGTATYLDLWDADHFDGFTNIQKNLSECRIWFSAEGYSYWDAPQTKTGRINCYFKAPSKGHYVCNVHLQSYGGPAQVECLIDNSSFGILPFNGNINQPHTAELSQGYHSFRIRQRSGSYFFYSLTVWKI